MTHWHTLDPSVGIEDNLNATAYISVVVLLLTIFRATDYPFLNGYSQQDNVPCNRTHIISSWFHGHDSDLSLLKRSAKSPDLSPIQQLWDEVEQVCSMECVAEKSAGTA